LQISLKSVRRGDSITEERVDFFTGAGTMTVAELIAMLQEFPPELPVFFCPDDDGRIALSPADAIMDLVHPGQQRVMSDEDFPHDMPNGFVDSLVIYPRTVREDLSNIKTIIIGEEDIPF